MYTLFLRFFCFTSLFFGQGVFGQTFLKKDLLIDLQYMDSAFLYGHPMNEIKSIPLNFSNSIQKLTISLPDTLSKMQYENAVREVLMEIKCSHTNVDKWSNSSPKKLNPLQFFPYHVFTDGSRIFVTESITDSVNSVLKKGFEIVSINGNKMDSVLPILKKYHPQDGNGYDLSFQMVNEMFPGLYAKCIDKDSIFEIVYKDEKSNILSTTEKGCPFVKRKEVEKTIDIKGDKAYLTLMNDTIAYLRIQAIQAKEQGFYEQVFQRIGERKISSLILDLRNNTGGSLFSSADLISYFISDTCSFSITLPTKNMRPFLSWDDKGKSRLNTFRWKIFNKFEYKKTNAGTVFTKSILPKELNGFKGNIYVLTNGFTASGASFITSYARHYGKAIVIGQKTGGAEFWNSAGSYAKLKLPKSGLKIQTATTHMQTDFSAKHFNGILPDFLVKYDANTYGVRDLEMELVFELMKK